MTAQPAAWTASWLGAGVGTQAEWRSPGLEMGLGSHRGLIEPKVVPYDHMYVRVPPCDRDHLQLSTKNWSSLRPEIGGPGESPQEDFASMLGKPTLG